MATTLRLEIVTPAGRVYVEDVEMVTLPGVAGQMGIYPHHVPLMTQMVPGEMIVRKDGHDLLIATGEGLIEVTTSRVAILTDLAIPAARGVALGRLFDALPQLPGQRGLEGRRVRRERGSGAPEGHGPFDRRLEVTGRHDIGATFRVYFRTEMPERP